MKIVIIAWRSWFIRRIYSLITHAKSLGHQVWGFATSTVDPELALFAFKELGIPAYPKKEFGERISEINPDVVIGLYYSQPLERWAQNWVTLHGKVGLLVNHFPVLPGPLVFGLPSNWRFTHLLVANQMQVDAITAGTIDRWPKERVHILGVPDFDFVTEQVDVPAVRARLGVKSGQSLIGIFPTSARFLDFGELNTFMAGANQRGWKVVIHPHPYDRKVQNAPGSEGWFFPKHSSPHYLGLQELGADFVVDIGPGTTEGVNFRLCRTLELIKAADCLLVSSFDVGWESYILGKRSHLLGSMLNHHDLPRPSISEPFGLDWERLFGQDNVKKVEAAFAPDRDFKSDPVLINKWIYKVDGLWWKRALALAEQLRG